MQKIPESLDCLLQEGIITGYNYFPKAVINSKYSLLSHFHESTEYLLDIFRYLQSEGYPNSNVIVIVRKKYSFTKWRENFRIRTRNRRKL